MNEEIEQFQQIYTLITGFVINYSFQILGAVVIILVGAWLAGKAAKVVEQLMVSKNIDITLSRFTGSIIKIVILVMVTIMALSKLGISITPFLAAVGALGLGAGLAVQGMFSNYAAGFTIIITRPFVVGDTIKVQGVTGIVDQVLLGYTILKDEDDVSIQIPNRHIVGEIIHNSSGNLLVELSIGVAYNSDPKQVTEIIKHATQTLESIDSNCEILVGIDNFGDSSINFGVRFLAPTDQHHSVRYQANRAIFEALQAANIGIPFPQREVRMLSE